MNISKMNMNCGGYDMEKVNNNFDERLKQYSEEIKSMEIVYQNGRVKYINKKNMINLKNRNIQDESRCIKSENQEKIFIQMMKSIRVLKICIV